MQGKKQGNKNPTATMVGPASAGAAIASDKLRTQPMRGQFRTAARRRPFLRTLNCITLATTKAMNGTTLWSRDFQDRVGRSYGSQVQL